MPCYDSRNDPEYQREEAKREFRHNSDVAELLCSVMKSLDGGTAARLTHRNPALAKWWAEHLIRDDEKRKAELRAAEQNKARAAYEADLKQLKKKHGIK